MCSNQRLASKSPRSLRVLSTRIMLSAIGSFSELLIAAAAIANLSVRSTIRPARRVAIA